jgi:TolA-binding protein
MNANTRLAIGSAALGFAMWIAAISPAGAQLDDFRTRQLMQDIAELKRVVRAQEQRIDQLEREVSRLTSRSPDRGGSRPADKQPSAAKAQWKNLKNWDRVARGMSEKQVLDILGYPTSARTGENGTVKTLFYTEPLGDTGFLSGHVDLANDSVRLIEKPALK